jgi:hypothetical protein
MLTSDLGSKKRIRVKQLLVMERLTINFWENDMYGHWGVGTSL